MHAPHPTHPIILPGSPTPVRAAAVNELSVDFKEDGKSWHLILSIEPGIEPGIEPCGSDRSIKQAEDTIAAFEHALNMRRKNHRAANRFANDDEQATYGRWLRALGDRLLIKSQRMTQYGDAIIADAPTAFRIRRAA